MALVLLLIGILPLKNHPIWTESGGNFTVGKYLGAICFIYAMCYLVRNGRAPQYLNTNTAKWSFAFFLLLFVSYIFFGNSSSPEAILMAASLVPLGITLLAVVDSLKKLRLVLLATVASVGWASLYVIKPWVVNHGWATGLTGEWVVGDRNYFAASIACVSPVAYHLRRALKGRWERSLCSFCFVLSLSALIIGGSRGGFLGVSSGMILAGARSRKRIRSLAAIVILGAAINVAYPHSPLARLLHQNASDEGSDYAHEASWEAGLNMIRTHPATGIGIGMFRARMLQYAPTWYSGKPFMAHSAYISVASELGLPGLFLFLGIPLSIAMDLERVCKQKSAPLLLTQAALGLQSALLGCSVAVSTISGEYHPFLWLTVFLGICVVRLAKRLPRVSRKTRAQEISDVPPLVVGSYE